MYLASLRLPPQSFGSVGLSTYWSQVVFICELDTRSCLFSYANPTSIYTKHCGASSSSQVAMRHHEAMPTSLREKKTHNSQLAGTENNRNNAHMSSNNPFRKYTCTKPHHSSISHIIITIIIIINVSSTSFEAMRCTLSILFFFRSFSLALKSFFVFELCPRIWELWHLALLSTPPWAAQPKLPLVPPPPADSRAPPGRGESGRCWLRGARASAPGPWQWPEATWSTWRRWRLLGRQPPAKGETQKMWHKKIAPRCPGSGRSWYPLCMGSPTPSRVN